MKSPLYLCCVLLFFIPLSPLWAQESSRTFNFKEFQKRTQSKTLHKTGETLSTQKILPSPQDLQVSLTRSDWNVWTRAGTLPEVTSSTTSSESSTPHQDLYTHSSHLKTQPVIQKSFHKFQIHEQKRSVFSEGHFSLKHPLVMYHPQTQNLGLLTGTLKLVTSSDIADFLKAYDLKLVHSFKDIHTYYVIPKQELLNLTELVGRLNNDPRLRSVTPEIVSRVYEKR